jgi:hypothetical protein
MSLARPSVPGTMGYINPSASNTCGIVRLINNPTLVDHSTLEQRIASAHQTTLGLKLQLGELADQKLSPCP